jgi:hypothetical protein
LFTPEIRSRIMRFEPGQVSEGHTHDVGHEMVLVLAGRAEFTRWQSRPRTNLVEQRASPEILSRAIETANGEAAHAALENMTCALQKLYARFREAELAWNEVSPAAAEAPAIG